VWDAPFSIRIAVDWQFQIWRKNLSGFQIKGEFRKLSNAKLVIDQDYVNNLTGLALNLELLAVDYLLILTLVAASVKILTISNGTFVLLFRSDP